MKIIVFGGTRYIGKALIKLLVDTDNEIYVLARGAEIAFDRYNNLYAFNINIDRKNIKIVKDVLRRIKPDIIIDNICFNENDARIICDLYEDCLQDCLKHFVFISTYYIYNYTDKRECYIQLENDSKIKKEAFYAYNKLKAEEQIFKSRIFSLSSIVRFPFVISCDDYTGRFPSLINLVKTTNKIKVSTKSNFQMSFIGKDVAAAFIYDLAFYGPEGFVDMANNRSLSYQELCFFVAGLLKKKPKFEVDENTVDIYMLEKDIILKSQKAERISSKKIPDIYEMLINEVTKEEDA